MVELVIKIDDETYKQAINRTEFDTLSLGVKLIEAVQNGTPLEEELEQIKDEIEDTGAYEQEVYGKTEFLKGITYCLNIINKYIEELKGEQRMTNEKAIEYLYDIKTDSVYQITTEEKEAIDVAIKALEGNIETKIFNVEESFEPDDWDSLANAERDH